MVKINADTVNNTRRADEWHVTVDEEDNFGYR
jgi:hypothetical protein